MQQNTETKKKSIIQGLYYNITTTVEESPFLPFRLLEDLPLVRPAANKEAVLAPKTLHTAWL